MKTGVFYIIGIVLFASALSVIDKHEPIKMEQIDMVQLQKTRILLKQLQSR